MTDSKDKQKADADEQKCSSAPVCFLTDFSFEVKFQYKKVDN